jgi:acetolactate synthase-1/2/3 large subunit
MTNMTGAQALVKSLYIEGVRVIFGLPGVQLYHAMDAIQQEPRIKFISTRHEQAAAYMADGYARAGGRVGTALVVPGPGLLNAAAAIGTAYAASSPVLIISGQIPKNLIGANRGVLHEVDDQLEAIKQVTKWAHRILDPSEIPDTIHQAFSQLQTGRPRPVEIEIPPETLAEEANIQLREPGNFIRPPANTTRLHEAARLLTGASNPLIWAGGGVILSNAANALKKVAERLQIPVVCTPEGKGSISDKHYLNLGVIFGRAGQARAGHDMSQHDVVLAIGTRLATPELLNHQLVIQVDIDPAEIGRNYQNTFGLIGDAHATLEGLDRILSTSTPIRHSKQTEIEALKESLLKRKQSPEPLNSLITAIRAAIPEDGILVSGMTQVGYYSRAHFPTYNPRTYLTSSYFGNLGYAFPTALGAKVACPNKAVVAICGDGGFLFNSQELATAVQYSINVTAIVFNDNAYGNVLRDQIERFEGRTIGSELHNPDFVALAKAYGARGVRVAKAADLEESLKEALTTNAPTLIEVPVGVMPSPFE